MRRESIVIVSAQGDYRKPRPAVIVQDARLLSLVDSGTVCSMTSDIIVGGILRVPLEPTAENRLQTTSQVQIEKIMTFPSATVGGPVGVLTDAEMAAVDHGLLFFLLLVQPILVSASSGHQ